MKTKLAMAIAVGLLAGSAAHADLIDSTMDLTLEQSGLAGELAGPTGGIHTYGGSDTFSLLTGPTWDAVSPAGAAGYDNSILLDLTNFQYASYSVLGPSTSTLDIENLAEEVAADSAVVFLPSDPGVDIAQFGVTSGTSIQIGWDVQAVVDANPVNPSAIIAWNSVPAPGPVALLGLAALLPFTGRRRSC